MSNLIFVNSQKGKKLLSYDGYLHSLHRSTENKCIWRCVEFIKYKCKGRCHTTNDEESGTSKQINTFGVKNAFVFFSQLNFFLLVFRRNYKNTHT